MARPTPDFPTRVLAIAVAIAVLLALLVWLLSGLGAPASTAATSEDEGAATLTPPEIPEGALPGEEPGMDTGLVSTDDADTLTLQLYMIDGASRELVPRVRRIQAPYPLATQAQMAIDALISAGEPGYVSPLPAETVVREVWVAQASGTAYVDLAQGFRGLLGGGSLTELHAAYAIVGTLTGTFPEIREVQILVNGRSLDTLNGHLDVSVPLIPLRDWLR